MPTTNKNLALTALAIVAAVAVWFNSGGAEIAAAQSVPRAPAQGAAASPEAQAEAKKEAAAKAQKVFDAGAKAYETGKIGPAIQSLTAAMQSGGLPSPQMAKALYYRGLAYRKQGKPAQAISDLTSAVWLKNGLSDRERSDALENRAAAYREAGVGEPPAEASLPWAAKETPTASANPAINPESWRQTATVEPQQAKPQGQAVAPESWGQTANVTSDPAQVAAKNPGSGISGFFSNLFSGFGSEAAPGPSSSPPPSPAAEVARPSAPEPALSSWSDKTTVSPARKN